MKERQAQGAAETALGGPKVGGLAGWIVALWRSQSRPHRSLALVEKIPLAPRQTLALVEADGRRLLVATSAEGAAAFFPLDEQGSTRPTGILHGHSVARGHARVSW